MDALTATILTVTTFILTAIGTIFAVQKYYENKISDLEEDSAVGESERESLEKMMEDKFQTLADNQEEIKEEQESQKNTLTQHGKILSNLANGRVDSLKELIDNVKGQNETITQNQQELKELYKSIPCIRLGVEDEILRNLAHKYSDEREGKE